MKVSQLYAPTLKESPSDTDVLSYQMLVRAGMIRKLSSGTYSYLPLGYRVIRKIEQIVREEMDAIDSQETLLPILLPSELWKESGRWEKFGPEMFRLNDRNEREYCLGPTHEEAFTDLVKHELKSYKQLPLSLYQIQNKYRDEIRPRFGLIRGKEFIMKDAYTFDRDQAGLEVNYEKMWKAYDNVFNRCELQYMVAAGDSGAMGGSVSHEFIAYSESGETRLVFCPKCDYASTDESAEVKLAYDIVEDAIELEKVHTPDVATIEDLQEFFKLDGHRFGKSLVYKTPEQVVVAVVPGNRSLNETKLVNHLGIAEHDLELANDDDIKNVLGSVVGFVGPMLDKAVLDSDKVKILVDSRITQIPNLIVGANEKDYHVKGVQFGRDFNGEVVEDLLMVEDYDVCPKCSETLNSKFGNELGNIFQLGTKYSESMGATFLDENGKENHYVMGSYGIGVSRTLAAVVEQYSNERGIVWPDSVAPYHVMVTVVNVKKEDQLALGEKIYNDLKKAGISVLLDDRKMQAGKKFADADLYGMPYRVTVGRQAAEGIVEFKNRHNDESSDVTAEEVVGMIKEILA